MDISTILARQMGRCPNRFWYQLNDQSAQENYNEQIENFKERLNAEEYRLVVESKVKTK